MGLIPGWWSGVAKTISGFFLSPAVCLCHPVLPTGSSKARCDACLWDTGQSTLDQGWLGQTFQEGKSGHFLENGTLVLFFLILGWDRANKSGLHLPHRYGWQPWGHCTEKIPCRSPKRVGY